MINAAQLLGRRAQFQITLASFIWLFAFMEIMVYRHVTSFQPLPDVDPLGRQNGTLQHDSNLAQTSEALCLTPRAPIFQYKTSRQFKS